MTNISAAYAEIINLMHTSKWHKKNCADSDCHVSILMLKMTASRLLSDVRMDEIQEATIVINQMDIV